MKCLAVLALSTLPAAAASGDIPMSAAEFEAYTTGKTLTFAADGQVYGIEEYLEGRRVRWAFLEDQCQDGVWYPQGQMICFVYEHIPDPQCWTFYRGDAGLIAQFENEGGSTTLFETRQSAEPLVCLGPEVGV
ncbi:MAG: hypothetical protein AAFY77_02285 [Pseudomonadota bacterium]